jgi:aminoacrylate hydrolase
MPFADLSDVRCRYEIMGHGDPLLMIAGLGSSCEMWGRVANQLAQSFTLILVDNRNMGQSEPRRVARGLMDLSADMVELLDHLQLDRTHVLGLSLGGIIAQRLAIDHPSRVDRLVLVSCTNRFGPYLRQIAKLLELTLRKFPFDIFQRTMNVLATSPEYFDAHAEEIEAAIAAPCNSIQHRIAIGRQLACLGCEEVAPPSEYRIQSPTLVLAGARDMLIPSTYAKKMADEISGSEFVEFPACGHDPLREIPQIAIPRVVRFLSRSSDSDGRNGRDAGHMIHGNELMAAMEDAT